MHFNEEKKAAARLLKSKLMGNYGEHCKVCTNSLDESVSDFNENDATLCENCGLDFKFTNNIFVSSDLALLLL